MVLNPKNGYPNFDYETSVENKVIQIKKGKKSK